MTWVVIIYSFDEDHRTWIPGGYATFYSDRDLLNFLRARAGVAYKYRYEITTVRGDEGNDSVTD